MGIKYVWLGHPSGEPRVAKLGGAPACMGRKLESHLHGCLCCRQGSTERAGEGFCIGTGHWVVGRRTDPEVPTWQGKPAIGCRWLFPNQARLCTCGWASCLCPPSVAPLSLSVGRGALVAVGVAALPSIACCTMRGLTNRLCSSAEAMSHFKQDSKQTRPFIVFPMARLCCVHVCGLCAPVLCSCL
jgi:hypothetical protein